MSILNVQSRKIRQQNLSVVQIAAMGTQLRAVVYADRGVSTKPCPRFFADSGQRAWLKLWNDDDLIAVDMFTEGTDEVHSLAVSKTDKHVVVGCSTRFGLYSIERRTLDWIDAPELTSSKVEAQAMAFSSMGGVFAVVTLYDDGIARICVFDILGSSKFSSSVSVPRVPSTYNSKVSDETTLRRAFITSVMDVANLSPRTFC